MLPLQRPLQIYKILNSHFGHRNWWPADTQFEVLVGAMLTQQASWPNVEKAIRNLKESGSLSIESIAAMPIKRLELLVRPSGYYRQKAANLKSLCRSIIRDYGSLGAMLGMGIPELRKALLSYKGIGRETADSIILYAAGKPIFVIDAYTKRAMGRIDPSINEGIDYDELRLIFERSLKRDAGLYNDFHAQFVELGKNYCRKRDPFCARCPLSSICSHAKGLRKF